MRSVLASLTSLSATLLLGCGAAPGEALDPIDAPAPCAEALCLTAQTRSALIETQAALEGCTPDAEQRNENDPSGLRISDIRLEGEQILVVTLANIASQGVFSYPTAGLQVEQGPLTVLGIPHNADPGVTTQPLYGILACQAMELRFEVSWTEAGRAELSAMAMDELGQVSIQAVPFALNRSMN